MLKFPNDLPINLETMTLEANKPPNVVLFASTALNALNVLNAGGVPTHLSCFIRARRTSWSDATVSFYRPPPVFPRP